MKSLTKTRWFRIAVVVAFISIVAGGWVLYGLEKANDAGVKISTSSPAEAQVIDQNKIGQAAKKAMPSVVAIISTKVVKAPQFPFPFGDDSPFGPFFDWPKRDQPEQRRQGLGSGVIISEDGYIVTNAHVVKEAEEIQVQLNDDRTLEAEIKGYDEGSDVALLKIDARGLPALPMGDSDKAEVGNVVLAIGSPFGLGNTVTMGIISATGRADLHITELEDFIQTDAAINPGNSGGALINLDGEFIGINTAILSRTGGYQGIGFAIPTNLAADVVDDLREHGEVVRGHLGIGMLPVDADLATSLGLDTPRGVVVTQVYEGTPAAEAGLKIEDIIVAVDGKAIDSAGTLKSRIAMTTPGKEVELTIIRNGKEMTKTIEIAKGDIAEVTGVEESGQPAMEGSELVPGLTVHNLTPAIRRQLGLDEGTTGVIISDVNRAKLDSRMPPQQGDIIVRVNGQTVENVEEARQIVEQSSSEVIRLLIKRGQMNILTTVRK